MLHPSNFVDERLRGRQADVLFTLRCDGRKSYLFVLLEHQSTADPLMAFRLLRYLVRIWDAFLVEHPESERLPPVIPVVVHHSERGWAGATDLCSVIDADAELMGLLAGYIPHFRFVLDDLSRADDQALRGRSLTALAAAGLMLLARGRGPNLLDDLQRWSDVFGQVAGAQNGVEALSALMDYTFQVGDVPPEELRRVALQMGPAAAEAYMTAAQKLTEDVHARALAEGKAEGRAEGKAELLLRLLGARFGGVPAATREMVLAAPAERVDIWADRLFTAHTLEEVLG